MMSEARVENASGSNQRIRISGRCFSNGITTSSKNTRRFSVFMSSQCRVALTNRRMWKVSGSSSCSGRTGEVVVGGRLVRAAVLLEHVEAERKLILITTHCRVLGQRGQSAVGGLQIGDSG